MDKINKHDKLPITLFRKIKKKTKGLEPFLYYYILLLSGSLYCLTSRNLYFFKLFLFFIMANYC